MASVVVCIILVLAIGVIALVVSEIVTVIDDSPVRPGLDVAICCVLILDDIGFILVLTVRVIEVELGIILAVSRDT